MSSAGNCGNSAITLSGAWNRKPAVGLEQHRRVVVAVAGGDHAVAERVERLDRAALLVGHGGGGSRRCGRLDDEAVAQDRRPAELAHQRPGELLERVRQDDHLGAARAGRRGSRRRPGAASSPPITSSISVIVRPCSSSRPSRYFISDVVVGLVAGGAAQFVDPGPFGDGDPDLGHEHALEVEGDHRRPRVAHRLSLAEPPRSNRNAGHRSRPAVVSR